MRVGRQLFAAFRELVHLQPGLIPVLVSGQASPLEHSLLLVDKQRRPHQTGVPQAGWPGNRRWRDAGAEGLLAGGLAAGDAGQAELAGRPREGARGARTIRAP